MKIKLEDIVNASNQINALLEIKLPVKVSYKLKRLADKIVPIINTFQEKRNELIKEYGDVNEDGSSQVKDPAKLPLFFDKVNELLSVEEDISWFEPIRLDELGDAKIEPKNITNFIFAEYHEDK